MPDKHVKPKHLRIDVYLDREHAEATDGGTAVRTMKIKAGMPTHPTPPGVFKISDKTEKAYSSIYGQCIDAKGEAHAATNGAASCHGGAVYHGTPMPFFTRFNGAVGFHAGSLTKPSHGCIHLGHGDAEWLFKNAPVGTPVIVHKSKPHAKPGSHQKGR
jgi:lipoprotein-anchoring transpeptidase ErfK/SrfK